MTCTCIEDIIKTFVSLPDQVHVTEVTREDGSVLFSIAIAKDDLGKVIGRNGQTIKALRAVVQSLDERGDKIYVDIAS